MEAEKSFRDEERTEAVVVEITENVKSESKLELSSTVPAQIQAPKMSSSSAIRRRRVTHSAYCKPKSRVTEPPYPSKPKPVEPTVPTPPPKSPFIASSKQALSDPITPRTPLMASFEGDEDRDLDEDDEVYQTDVIKLDKAKKGTKVNILQVIEWTTFVSLMAVLITSLTVHKLRGVEIWSLQLWKWSVLAMAIFCGHLFTEWLTETVVFLIEKKFLLKKKVLYFIFGLKRSVYIVIWLSLILLVWVLLINRGVERSAETSKVLNYITRGIASTLVGGVLWMVKTLLIKLIASSFHVRTYFDRIQESIFHQYILQTLSGPPLLANSDGESSKWRLGSGKLSFSKSSSRKEDSETIDVDKLYRMKKDKVSAWTMQGLTGVIRNSAFPTVSEMLDEESGEPSVITSEVEARDTANRIFRNVAKDEHKYIEEDDLLRFMPKEEVNNAIPLFEGAAESRRIKKSAFRNWVVKAYNERRFLALCLADAKTAIEELNRLSSALILLVIVIVWLLLMEITTTRVLVFISSQILLVVFMFGNTIKTVFEAIIFVFIVHPFDVGDRCVVDGAQMIVDEMNLLTTIFLKPDNEKVYYPNAVLATKAISNYNRSPEMMGDSVEFAVDFSTSVECIVALKSKIKLYLDSKPHQWNPSHSLQIKEIVDMDKMIMALYVTHTLNFQNAAERVNRRSDLIFEIKKILQDLGIGYHLLPREVLVKYVEGAISTPL